MVEMNKVPNGKKINITLSNGTKRSFYTEMESYEDVATFFQSIVTNKVLFIRFIDNSVEGIFLRDISSIRVFDAEYGAMPTSRTPYPSAMAVEELAVSKSGEQSSTDARLIQDPNIGGIVISGL